MFRDRIEAGQKLAQKLEAYRNNKDALVFALPRGGVVLGFEIAGELSLPLDIIATRKIGHPLNPEYAIGAVDRNGITVLNETETVLIDKRWLQKEIGNQQKEAKRRDALYHKKKRCHNPASKIVILVDDGIATGFTMRLAVQSIKNQCPKKIIVATPVATEESIQKLTEEGADEIIVLEPPEKFLGSIGAHYQEFKQVDDASVLRLLETVH